MLAFVSKRLRSEQGFTLIELIVVLIILGLLIALALPNYLGARQTAAKDEARVIGQEWRTLAWACFLQTNNSAQCNTDLLVGFSENNSTNWDFKNNTATAFYTVSSTASSGSIVRCAPGLGSSSTVSGLQYEIQLFVTGTGAGTSSDVFVANNGCGSL